MQSQKFKVGDKVKCINITYADSWGKGEMLVEDLYKPTADYTSVHCFHPEQGKGAFYPEELVKAQSLEEQKQQLLNQLYQINIRLADEKEKARMQLADKEIEIKLTLNELAWVVSALGIVTNIDINFGIENLEKSNEALLGIFKKADFDSHFDNYIRLKNELVKAVNLN